MPQQWIEPTLGLGGVLLMVGGSIVVAWMQGRFKTLEVMARPTSNGFADGTTKRLDALLIAVGEVKGAVDHLDGTVTDLEARVTDLEPKGAEHGSPDPS